MGRSVLAVLADGPAGPSDARAADERLQRPYLLGRLHCGDHLASVGDVGGHKGAIGTGEQLLGPLVLGCEVGDDDAHAALDKEPDRGLAQPRGAAGDDRRRPAHLHGGRR